ncbi:hypothetical protein ACROYT_G014380 [Oculina patagonica]
MIIEAKGSKKDFSGLLTSETYDHIMKGMRVPDWVLLYFKLQTKFPDSARQTLLNLTQLGKNNLKPDNVLLEKRLQKWNPVIIDFAKARFMSNPKLLMPLLKSAQERYHTLYPHIAPALSQGTGQQNMTFKAVMDRASATTIPFGWDDAENSTMIKQVAAAFFNQVAESHPKHLKVWNEKQVSFLLKVLDAALNCIPDSEKDLQEKDEKEFGDWLTKQDF